VKTLDWVDRMDRWKFENLISIYGGEFLLDRLADLGYCEYVTETNNAE
jgi:hypothetical protein